MKLGLLDVTYFPPTMLTKIQVRKLPFVYNCFIGPSLLKMLVQWLWSCIQVKLLRS